MGLPTQLKSARMTDDTTGILVDDNIGDLEQALCDITGLTINTNVTESALELDNSGRITKQLLRLVAAAVMGIRFRDSTNSKEFRLALNNTNILIDENTSTESSPVWSNRLTIALGTGLVTLGSATDPSAANDLARKAYVDAKDALSALLAATQEFTGDNTFSGAVTFGEFPVTPSAAPDADYEVSNKKYVDDELSAFSGFPEVYLEQHAPSGTHGGGVTVAKTWTQRAITRKTLDTDSICTLGTNEFTIPAGTYLIDVAAILWYCNSAQIRLYNATDEECQQTDDLVDIKSQTGYAPSYAAVLVRINSRFTTTAENTFQIHAACEHAQPTYNFGRAITMAGEDEIYMNIKLTKVA